MSTQQRSHACMIAVDPSLGDILRRETLVVLEDHHHYFEDLLDLRPAAQHALSVIFRDAFAVLDALGWSADPAVGPVDVPMTAGYVERLRRRRYDLGFTNLDRLDTLDDAADDVQSAATRIDIEADRLAAQSLDRLFSECDRAVRS